MSTLPTDTLASVPGPPGIALGLSGILSLVRRRFLLYAGLLPYLLGAAWACGVAGEFDGRRFWSGLAGVLLAIVGAMAFNEYFDSRMRINRRFAHPEALPPSDGVLWLGIAAFTSAFAVGLSLAMPGGWHILVLTVLGGAAAIFYAAPPLRWACRGLGELVTGLAYGPWMVSGSAYLQLHRFPSGILWASCAAGLLIMALAVANAIADFHRDRLIGKRTLAIRVGRRRAVWLYVGLAAAALLSIAVGTLLGHLPMTSLAALIGTVWLVDSARCAATAYAKPQAFVSAIRALVRCYALTLVAFTAGILLTGLGS